MKKIIIYLFILILIKVTCCCVLSTFVLKNSINNGCIHSDKTVSFGG